MTVTNGNLQLKHVDAIMDPARYITHTNSEVLIYTDAITHICKVPSCNGFDHSNHSGFGQKSKIANKLFPNAQFGFGDQPVAYSKGTTGSFLWGTAGGT